jgi:ketosteroid isomerase-like protein
MIHGRRNEPVPARRHELTMRHLAICAFAAALAWFCLPAFAGDCATLDSLAWLPGEWIAEGEKSTFRESWAARGPRTWEGQGSETSKTKPADVSSEELRLVEMKGGVFYIAKVSHNPLPVAFHLSECGDGRFTFVNPAHDFPRRIDYVRQGDDRLDVRVSDGAGDGFTLNFIRVAGESAKSAEVLAAEDARFAAMVAADPEAMRRWFADDVSYVHSTGEVANRAQLIDALVSGRLRYLAIEPSERRVSFPGTDVAIVQGLARFQARAGPQAVDFPGRYLAVYRRAQGGWRLQAWQSLRLP